MVDRTPLTWNCKFYIVCSEVMDFYLFRKVFEGQKRLHVTARSDWLMLSDA